MTDKPLLIHLRQTARALGLLLKAFFLSFAFCGIGSAVAPLVFIGMMLGMFPNIVRAALCWIITLPLLCFLPFQATYGLALILRGRTPDYAKGIYGAADWVETNKLYDPSFRKPEKTKDVL